MAPPMARRTVAPGARAAAVVAVAACWASAMSTLASQSSTMYPASSPDKCQLTGVSRMPERPAAKTVSENSGRLLDKSAAESPASTPRARRARASWLARAFSSAKVRLPLGLVNAG